MIRKRGAVFAAVMAVLLFVSAGFTGCSSQENGKSEKEEQTREETGKEEKADTADKKKEPVSVTAPEKSDASREPGKDSGEAKSSPNAPETSDPKTREPTAENRRCRNKRNRILTLRILSQMMI